jgi:hypothetical protein
MERRGNGAGLPWASGRWMTMVVGPWMKNIRIQDENIDGKIEG